MADQPIISTPNPTNVIVHMETARVEAPKFYGDPETEDPLAFLGKFKEAAIANNWLLDQRKLAMIGLSLQGIAKSWFQDEFIGDDSTAFDDQSNSYFTYQFKKEYLTPRWQERYRMDYWQRVQLPGEKGIEYITNKLVLAKRCEQGVLGKIGEKDKVADVISGL
ncbi:hypothetical protein INT45_007710 [Circinella minor]|uniref:Retrotransposon gag domain-containing protein n=1 Tax=Circinella minor TaxID=1195481 RepID=A0A8H7RNW9_9FUNG|nr:hypothetical protein INT45_007710 [Circinella minor]